MTRFLLLVFALSYTSADTSADDWNYDNTTDWPDTCQSGQSQSPINLANNETTKANLSKLHFTDAYSTTTNLHDFIITNNGHTVQIDVFGCNRFYITNGGLPSTYRMQQLHMHWGSNDDQGSEHTINGKAFPLEIHFVHFDEKYGNFNDSINQMDGLAVIAVFVQLIDKTDTNDAFDAIVSQLNAIEYKDNTTTMQPFKLFDLMPVNKDQFYRYNGSLTTPPCYESVIWTVMKNPITISTETMNKLRSGLFDNVKGIMENVTMVNNTRPVQALNGRELLRNFDFSGGTRTSSFTATNLLVMAAVATALAFRLL